MSKLGLVGNRILGPLRKSGKPEAPDIRRKTSVTNVYHCCVHKTGSQWLKQLLSDPVVYQYSGLRTYQYQSHLPERHDPRKLTERTFSDPFPEGTVVTPLYIDYPGFRNIPKPASYRAFFVCRDPRDILVSWYFSAKTSHVPGGIITEKRSLLGDLSTQDGLLLTIEHLEEKGIFPALRSWSSVINADPLVLFLRFEELTQSNDVEPIRRLLTHCDIEVPTKELEQLVRKYTFDRLSGRRPGQEDPNSHYRKGIQGDWQNYFDATIHDRFKEVTGDLISVLGYEDTNTR